MASVRLGAFLLFASFVAAPHKAIPQSRKPPVAEPNLPVIDFDACGSPNPRLYSGRLVPYNLEANDDLYSSWQDDRTLVRRLAVGTEVTRIGAVNVIQEPDRAVITGEVDESLRPLVRGDEVLGYALHSDGEVSFWGKGVLFSEHFDNIAFKGSCGFADKTQCRVNITRRGVQQWWMQLKTSDGVTGWILGLEQIGDKFSYGPNAGYACRE